MPIEDRSLDCLTEETPPPPKPPTDPTQRRRWKTHTQKFKLLKVPSGDHYIYVDDDKVLSGVDVPDDKAYFKVHDILDYDPMKDVAFHVIILEHASTGKIMAIDKEQNTVVMKEIDPPPSQFINLLDVNKAHPEVLFYKMPRFERAPEFFLKSYLSDKPRVLKFEENGQPKLHVQERTDFYFKLTESLEAAKK
ncbi:uncharacterized protein [Pocillopora verrucosa]|uniref:Uncharacterized protein n=1 Tax=Pocillopora damicornis TaxID=46731 RepID=A0A3M6UAM5_POCDA|nr:uncharacterized protein LOC113666664 [Pocillopora damicornis]XP_058940471.1 uncharacterized protein LOC131768760 [Pocillopora verrucosa]RMX50599.1 hypothetical protein pdam_00009649 [Pocillopora damicornis]